MQNGVVMNIFLELRFTGDSANVLAALATKRQSPTGGNGRCVNLATIVFVEHTEYALSAK
jgi:hypothetical protein